MEINLNNPEELTEDNVANLIESGDDSSHTQLRVTKSGIAFLSKIVGAVETNGLAFRLETWDAGNDWVGTQAAKDAKWVARIYKVLKSNWPNPTSTYIDLY